MAFFGDPFELLNKEIALFAHKFFQSSFLGSPLLSIGFLHTQLVLMILVYLMGSVRTIE